MEFEKIWSLYRSNLKAFLHSKVSNPDEVDDLLQNIMIKVYQNLHRVKSESSVKSWLFQITNNAIIDFYRKKSNMTSNAMDDFRFKSAKDTIDTDLAECIEPFIAALPKDASELLEAIDINGQSQKEVAESMGLSYSTLKSRVQKSRKQLRELFLDCCHFSLDHNGNIIDYEFKSGKRDKC